jgi:hypothetical protein
MCRLVVVLSERKQRVLCLFYLLGRGKDTHTRTHATNCPPRHTAMASQNTLLLLLLLLLLLPLLRER